MSKEIKLKIWINGSPSDAVLVDNVLYVSGARMTPTQAASAGVIPYRPTASVKRALQQAGYVAPPEPWGLLVRFARTKAKMSQSELARRIGCTQALISHWERRHKPPRMTKALFKLQSILNVKCE